MNTKLPYIQRKGIRVAQPTTSEQQNFWNNWVSQSRDWENNRDNSRRGASVLKALAEVAFQGMNILDIGCGSGWLALQLTTLCNGTAVDLASEAVDQFKR